MEYSVVSADDLIRFWRSKVKVTAGLSITWWALVAKTSSKTIF